MRRKRILLGLSMLFLMITTATLSAQSRNQAVRPAEKLNMLMYYLDNVYVDSVDQEKVVKGAMESIFKDLDPHSYYLTKEEVKEMEEPLQGNFEGIGVQFNIFHDTIIVMSTISGGPSEKVGIRSGDKIVFINDTLVAGVKITNNDVFKKLRGKKGTKVKVKVERPGEKKLIEFEISRDKIPVFSVDAAYMAAPEIAYIKINRFSNTTFPEFREALAKLKAQGAKSLILDLADNGGGYLHAATDLADEFLKSGDLIVYTEGRNASRENYRATAKGEFEEGKLVVLINEGSASASEIVSGAVQDLERGVVVGRRSFGKGLVQNAFPFPDGSMVRLTVSRYYTPSGRCIQAPYDQGTEQYYKDLYTRYNKGELTDQSAITFPDSLKYTTKGGRTVYGGGGVMPDVFIPLDTTFYTDYFGELVRNNVTYEYCLEKVNANRAGLHKQYPSFQEFNKTFKMEEKDWKDFLKYAEKKGVKTNEKELKISKDFIENRIKAIYAQDLWGRDEFFQVWNEKDDTYLKAVEIIQNGKFKGIQYFD